MHPVVRVAAGIGLGVVVTSKGLVVGMPGPVAYLGGIAGALYVIASWAPATLQSQPDGPPCASASPAKNQAFPCTATWKTFNEPEAVRR